MKALFLLVVGYLCGVCDHVIYVKTGRQRGSYAVLMTVIAFGLFALLSGCAALPMEMQPKEQSSAYTEGAWLTLHAVDTLQTLQIARHHNCLREGEPAAAWIYGSKYPAPARVAVTNIAGAVVHMLVTSWLDDMVSEHPESNGWYYSRVSWRVVSLAYSGYSVGHNIERGIYPTSVHNKDCAI